MSKSLSSGGFKWLSEEETEKLNVEKYVDDSKKGLILEVDLEYPKHLHDAHNDYPLALEKLEVYMTRCSSIVAK